MANNKQIEIVQVCFNVLDPDQRVLYDHVRSRKNRSGYLKRLIQRDIDREFGGGEQPAITLMVERPSEADFNPEGFI